MPGARTTERGVAMIEVLIAIVVLSFGLLGVAGLQLIGLKSNQTAYLRSVATSQAYDLADRMRANMDGVKAGNYSPLSAATSLPSCATPFTAAGCDAAKMAQFDAKIWLDSNAVLLPSGSGSVAKSANSNAYVIAVSWKEKCQKNESGCGSDGFFTTRREFVTSFVP